MGYLSQAALEAAGFKRVGKGVKVSDKASIYNCDLIELGDFSRIDDFCVISGGVQTGRNVYIGPQCLVAGGEKGVVFSDFTTLAYQVQVFTQSDDYSGATLTNPTIPRKFKNEKKASVFLGRHVIVGAGSVVLPGVHLAEGCSVGAMSLVLRSTEPWGIYAGNPARRLKDRKQDLLRLEAEFLSESPPGA